MTVNNMSSMLRISGISSGLDTDSMVKSLMKIEQLRVDQVLRQKTKLEWSRDMRQDINKQINDLRYSYASVLSNKNLNVESAFKVHSVDMSDSSAVSISANSSASVGSHIINSITQLASSAQVNSASRVSTENLNRSDTLETISAQLDTALTFDVNDQISFKINDQTFTFDKTSSLDNMLRTVNNSDAGVNMTYSAISGGFKIESKTTGAASALSVENLSGNAFANNSVDDSAFKIDTTSVEVGKNAILSVDGYTIEQESNIFTLDGITFDLKTTTDQSITFAIRQDVDGVVDKIKSFVEDYNKLVGSLNDKISEKIQYDYEPLTDEQKEEMTESEIEKWEEMAKSGLMRNDRQISGLLSDMRSAIYEKVEGVGKSLFDIGIKTGSWADKGKLVIDEDKLREALQNNPDDVAAVFAQDSTSEDAVIKRANSGFMERISLSMSDYVSSYSSLKVEQDIGKVAERILKLQDDMYAKEESYWRKFSAMETALGSLNSQSSWLTQQIASF